MNRDPSKDVNNEQRDLQIVDCLSRAEQLPPAEYESFVRRFFEDDPDAVEIVLGVLQTPMGELGPVWDLLEGNVSSPQTPPSGNQEETTEWSESNNSDTVRIYRTESALPEIPGHQLRKVIGRGGMGIVVEAFDEGLQIDVAIKLIRDKLMETPTARRRFLREARSVARLQHPNIVAVRREGETEEGVLWFSMDRIIGTPLNRLIANETLSIGRIVAITKGIAEGLACAHEKNIFHRDIKPANVIIDEQDQPKVVDFGLAKNVETDEAFTRDGLGVGTPPYMAPEQISTEISPITPATDIYALGATLYSMLAGEPPFRYEDFGDHIKLLNAVVHQAPEPPLAFRRDIPKDLNSICMKCLEKRPSWRYQNATALIEDLERFSLGMPVKARPIGRMSRSARWMRRNPIAVTALSTLSVLVILAGYFWNRSNANESIAKERAETLAVQKSEITLKADALAAANESMQHQLYGADIRDANHFLEDGRYENAFQKLIELIPEPGSVDRRGIEWGMLWNRLIGPYRFQYACGSPFHYPKQHFSLAHDNRTVAFWFGDATYLWDYRFGKLKKRFERIALPRYLGDGKRWAFTYKGTVCICDVNSLVSKVRWRPNGRGEVVDMTSNDDGSLLAIVIERNPILVQVIASDSGESVFSAEGSSQGIRAACFSPDDRYLVIANRDHSIYVFDMETGKRRELSNGYMPLGLDFSPDGKFMIACPLGYRAKIWRTEDWSLEAELTGNDKAWRVAKFTSDGKHIVMAGYDGRIWHYRVSDWKLLSRHTADLTVWYGDLSPSGQHFVLGGRTGNQNEREGFANGGTGIRVFHLDRDFQQGLLWHDWAELHLLGARGEKMGPHSTSRDGKRITQWSSEKQLVYQLSLDSDSEQRLQIPVGDIAIKQLQSFGNGRYTGYITEDGQAGYLDWRKQSMQTYTIEGKASVLTSDDLNSNCVWVVGDKSANQLSRSPKPLETHALPVEPKQFKRCQGISFAAEGNTVTAMNEKMEVIWQQSISDFQIDCLEPLDPNRVLVCNDKRLVEVSSEGIDPWPLQHQGIQELHCCDNGERLLVVYQADSVGVHDTKTRRLLCEADSSLPRDVCVDPQGQWITVRDEFINMLEMPRNGDVLNELLQMVESGESSPLVKTGMDRLLAWAGASSLTKDVADVFYDFIEIESLLQSSVIGNLDEQPVSDAGNDAILLKTVQRSLDRMTNYRHDENGGMATVEERIPDVIRRCQIVARDVKDTAIQSTLESCANELSNLQVSLEAKLWNAFTTLDVGESRMVSSTGWGSLIPYGDSSLIGFDKGKVWIIDIPSGKARTIVMLPYWIGGVIAHPESGKVYVGTKGTWNSSKNMKEYVDEMGVIKVDVATGVATAIFRDGKADYRSLCFTEDRKSLLASGYNAKVHRLDLATEEVDVLEDSLPNSVCRLRPGTSWVYAFSGPQSANRMDLNGHSESVLIDLIDGVPIAADFFPDSSVVALLSAPNKFVSVDVETGDVVHEVNTEFSYSTQLCVSPLGQFAFACDRRGSLHRLSVSPEKSPEKWNLVEEQIFGLALLPETNLAAFSTAKGTFITKLAD